MTHPHFFGYGSLVNRATHDYPNARKAQARGWRRAWVHTASREFAFLSVIRAPGHQIAGLMAEVPNADWEALDAREYAYDRVLDSDNIDHDHPAQPDIAIYQVPDTAQSGVTETHPILLSYLDVVFQGYIQEFGTAGAEAFIATTDGWNAPILNDRAAPIYPRHQMLSTSERSFVDNALLSLGADTFMRD